jgi:hypothetical protein
MALVKYNNNSISAVTSAASIPSGAMTLIKTLTASSSATLSFVHGASDVVLDSTYPIYKFEFINIHPATDNANFLFQTSTDSGSNYNTTLTSTFFYAYHFENDSAAVLAYDANFDQAQGTAFQRIIDAIGNLADESGSGTLYLFNPSSTTFVKHYMSNCNSYVDGTYSTNYFSAGYYNTTSAIDAVQFKMSSGNIDAGTIKLYGIKDS